MGFRQWFVVRLAGRTALLVGATMLATAFGVWGVAPTAMLIAALVAVGAAAAIWQLVSETNAELARFVVALDRGDMTQAFARQGRGAGFDRVGAAYDQALSRLRDERAREASGARFAEALLDGAPTPLLVLGDRSDDPVEVGFANKAARRLFGRTQACALDALRPFGADLVAALRDAAPGATRLVRLTHDGLPQRVTLDTTAVLDRGQQRRIVAIKSIQAELDGAELTAQVDLVRVLTHEIMNSLTPVTSLSATAQRLIDGVDPTDAPGIADAQLAIAALARRAGELEHFVESYKGFSEAPALVREVIPVQPWLTEVMRLFTATPAGGRVRSAIDLPPEPVSIMGDRTLLTQVMLNLLKNAAEAVADTAAPAIDVTVASTSDRRIRIAVEDNGPGIPPHLADDVFLPFFTTKRTGTGIGLSLARQIILRHEGQIGSCGTTSGCIELSLPLGEGG